MQPLKVEWEGNDQDRTPEQPPLQWGWFGANWKKYFLNFMIMKKNVQDICKSQLMSDDFPLEDGIIRDLYFIFWLPIFILPLTSLFLFLAFSSHPSSLFLQCLYAAGIIKMFKDILLELIQRNRET